MALAGEQPEYHVLAGGLLLGAFFMATDYPTSPQTSKGRLIFGIGCGIFTVIIRLYGNYPEGVSFAILIMNMLVPYINRFTMSKALGGKKS
jgi:electron transport complex protein RnfD